MTTYHFKSLRTAPLTLAALFLLVCISACAGSLSSSGVDASTVTPSNVHSQMDGVEDRSAPVHASGSESKTVSSSIGQSQGGALPTYGSESASPQVPAYPAETSSRQSFDESMSQQDDAESAQKPGAHQIAFRAMSQYPELPNGCEVTSLASVLGFLGYTIDKGTLSDIYLPKAPVGQANFYAEFVGNPRDDDAYGCYSPVIVATANGYLTSVGSGQSAYDVGGPFEGLLHYIDEDIPVIVWATQGLQESYYSVTWNVNGQDMTWRTPEHCMVLVGYDDQTRSVQVADPMLGEVVTYNMDLFEARYNELGQQAVVIR